MIGHLVPGIEYIVALWAEQIFELRNIMRRAMAATMVLTASSAESNSFWAAGAVAGPLLFLIGAAGMAKKKGR